MKVRFPKILMVSKNEWYTIPSRFPGHFTAILASYLLGLGTTGTLTSSSLQARISVAPGSY